jgi:hypothetical protein
MCRARGLPRGPLVRQITSAGFWRGEGPKPRVASHWLVWRSRRPLPSSKELPRGPLVRQITLVGFPRGDGAKPRAANHESVPGRAATRCNFQHLACIRLVRRITFWHRSPPQRRTRLVPPVTAPPLGRRYNACFQELGRETASCGDSLFPSSGESLVPRVIFHRAPAHAGIVRRVTLYRAARHKTSCGESRRPAANIWNHGAICGPSAGQSTTRLL